MSKSVSFNTPSRRNLNEDEFRESRGNFSGLKASQMRESSPIRKQPVLRLEDEDELVRAMREQISHERELDTVKIALIQKSDFNLFDAFRIFDIDSRGYITMSDLRSGLNEIGIFPSTEELDLFFKRYDKNQDGRIRFSEFCDSFSPSDNYYATLLNRRTSNNARGRFYSRDDCFLSDTKVEFRNVWRTHFKIEVYAE